MTKAMAPWEHELSQTVGLAMAVVAAAYPETQNPATVVTFEFTKANVRDKFLQAIVALEIMLLDFDAECDDLEDIFERQMADWRTETEWSNYELIGAAA